MSPTRNNCQISDCFVSLIDIHKLSAEKKSMNSTEKRSNLSVYKPHLLFILIFQVKQKSEMHPNPNHPKTDYFQKHLVALYPGQACYVINWHVLVALEGNLAISDPHIHVHMYTYLFYRKRKLEEVAKHEKLRKHPNCVGFVKAWEEKQHLYIQTELCQMRSVEQ